MKYLKIIILMLAIGYRVFAADSYNCSDKNIEIKAKGFTGYGAQAQKIKTVGRLSPTTSEASTYQRSFEIGFYRFVKEADVWAVYRKNDQGVYLLKREIQFPVKVSIDQPIYVSKRDKNVLEVRRNTDDKNSTFMTIVFGREKMNVNDSEGNSILLYNLCPTVKKPASIPKAIAPSNN